MIILSSGRLSKIDRLCLYRPTARIPLSMNSWYTLSAALINPCHLTPRNPDKVLVLDLIEKGDSVRSYSDAFIKTSANIGNKFTLFNPKSAQEARKSIRQLSPEIVVITVMDNTIRQRTRYPFESKENGTSSASDYRNRRPRPFGLCLHAKLRKATRCADVSCGLC